MRIVKKLVSLALTLALIGSMALPAAAVKSSFSDVTDDATAVNADILRLMGVVSGTGGNQFTPDLVLTRAQFCTMMISFKQERDQLSLHTARTVFTDVPASHWARAYVNLAASLTVDDGDAKIPLISGVGDGRFLPDSPITLAQATTILLRVLGYNSKQTGALWPQSYMELARSIGLTDGLPADYNVQLTRAQAAQLFVNALSCKTGGGELYYKSLGARVEENAIILAVNVRTDDGSSDGAIRATSSKAGEAYLPANGQGNVTALQGKRGELVLDSKGRVITFVPDDSAAITVTLSGDAQASYVKDTNGKQYTMNKSTLLYTADSAEGKDYALGYSALKSGSQVTMYAENGKIVAVYGSGSAAGSSSDAVVVMGSPSVAMFHQLTGGATDFAIQKNRQPITISQIQPYDVVTYDSLNNTLIVSDLRLTCIYEDAEPNAKAPTTVKILGHSFDVLDSAWDTVKNFSLGNQVSLLLTADGKVAGMVKPDAQTRSNAIGRVRGSAVELFLSGGGTIELSTVNNADDLDGQVVSISSGNKGKVSVSRLPSRTAPGELSVERMTLGSYAVSNGVRVYERVGTATAELNLGDLRGVAIKAGDIDAYHLNSSNMVDCIVLKAVTGDAYTYGELEEGKQSVPGWSDSDTSNNRTVTVRNGTGGLSELVTGYAFKDGSFGGVVEGSPIRDANGSIRRASSVIVLTAVKNVSPSDFFVSQGVTYVNAGGKTYRVADKVEGYKSATKEWFTQESGQDRLAAVKAFSNDLTVYVDPVGEKVRVVVAN